MTQLELALHDPASVESMQDDLAKYNQRAFMEVQVVFGSWVMCELKNGDTVFVEDDYFDASDDEIVEHQPLVGWGARFNAPGHLDCSDWAVFDTESEAVEYLWNQLDLEEINWT